MQEQSIFLLYIQKSYKHILAFAVACAFLGFGISYIIPHTYQSAVMVLPADQKNSGMGLASLLSGNLPGGLGGMIPGGESKNSFLSPEIVLSRSIAEHIVNSKSLDTFALFQKVLPEDKVEAIQNTLTIDTRRSGIVILESEWSTGFFAGKDEKLQASTIAAIIANTASNGIDSLIKNKSMTSAKRARIFIDKLLAENKTSLDSAYSVMQTFQQNNKVLELENQSKALVESAVSAGTELSEAEIELALAKQQYQDHSPALEMMQKKVATLRSQYGKVQTGGIMADQFSIPFAKLPALSKSYITMIRDIKIMEQINAYLQSQRTQEYIQEIRDVPAIQIVEKAIPARKQSSPKRLIFSLLCFFAGAVLSSGFGIISTIRKNNAVSV